MLSRELEILADEIEQQQEEIKDFETQRDYLIDKVVLGQRLALSRMRWGIKQGLNKAWARWISFLSKDDQKLGAAAKNAVKNIQSVKQKIQELEEENSSIAE